MNYGKFIEVKGTENCRFFRALSAAASKDMARYFMNFVYCDNGSLLSTDGRRLVKVDGMSDTYGFEDGKLYKPIKTTLRKCWLVEVEPVGQFPNWRRVFPKGEPISTVKYKSVGKTNPDFSLEYFKLLKHNPVQIAYVQDIPAGLSFDVKFYDGGRLLKFDADNIEIIIMSMRGDKDER